jgi:hypothetical protein
MWQYYVYCVNFSIIGTVYRITEVPFFPISSISVCGQINSRNRKHSIQANCFLLNYSFRFRLGITCFQLITAGTASTRIHSLSVQVSLRADVTVLRITRAVSTASTTDAVECAPASRVSKSMQHVPSEHVNCPRVMKDMDWRHKWEHFIPIIVYLHRYNVFK